MGRMAAAALQAIASIAEKHGAMEVAKALAAYGDGDYSGAGYDLASAAAWFALAGGLSAAGSLSGGAGGGGSHGGGVLAPNTNQGGSINPIAGTFGSSGPNVKKFADGGLISGTTLAMMGEGGPASAGNRPQEAAIPLDNPEAVSKIKEALGGGGGDTHHWHVRGLVSPDTLSKVADQLSGGVKKRKINLYSTNTFRVQKRST